LSIGISGEAGRGQVNGVAARRSSALRMKGVTRIGGRADRAARPAACAAVLPLVTVHALTYFGPAVKQV
jgi:hypothetical protein